VKGDDEGRGRVVAGARARGRGGRAVFGIADLLCPAVNEPPGDRSVAASVSSRHTGGLAGSG
jgi:hypothetical protein